MRIATWNLERPSARSWRKLPAQLEQMRGVDADVWVLTETRASIAPSDAHRYAVHAPPHPARRPDPDERWVSIWSRYPLRDAGIQASPRGTVAAVVASPMGDLVVYGTVVPWAHEPSPDGAVRLWSVHRDELARQAAEWRAVAATGMPLCVAGDFNQAWQGRGYGTHELRAAHHAAAASADLDCLTADEVTDGLPVIDHILLSREWVGRYGARVAGAWSGRRADGLRMCDHGGAVVEIRDLQLGPSDPGSTVPRAPTG